MCVRGVVGGYLVATMLPKSIKYYNNACGVGVSDVYMFNNVGHRTLPCGTSVLNWH